MFNFAFDLEQIALASDLPSSHFIAFDICQLELFLLINGCFSRSNLGLQQFYSFELAGLNTAYVLSFDQRHRSD